ncbi:MAG: extracellular solute-binding protein, partial [Proteobacteria bacterium]|nr:extracellular solute-binding protein [Pseudomonadota bacterium]
RETIGFALRSLGYSSNSEDPAELEAALEHLLEIKQDIIFADPYAEDAVPLLISGEAAVLVGWADDALDARDELNETVVYVFTEDGFMLWGDNFAIPANSPHQYTAEVFVDFILQPANSAQIVNETCYYTANEAARPLVIHDPMCFPSDEVLKKAEVILPLSPAGTKLHDEIWERFTTAIQ